MKAIQKICVLMMVFCLIIVTAPVMPAYAEDEPEIGWAEIYLDQENYTYTGKAITPEPKLVYEDKTLVKDTDYTLSYENNINAGDAIIRIKGTGSFVGETEQWFRIDSADLSEIGATLTLSQESFAYTGEEIKPTVTVKAYGKTLKQSTEDEEYDYYVDYWDNYDVGTATAVVSGQGNYCGELRKEFTITGTDISTLENLKVDMQEGPFTYTGAAIKPEVYGVSYEKDGETYSVDIDYDNISYTNNVNVGTATIEIPAGGNYSGKITKSFTIKPRDFSEDLRIESEIYDDSFKAIYKDSAITPQIYGVYCGDYLVDAKSYKVEYVDNVNAGDAKIIITGTDSNNVGKAEFGFTIEPADLSEIGATLTLDPETSIYTPQGAKPKTIVKAFGKTLEQVVNEEGGDYEVWFDNNEAVGEAKVTVSGKGNYTGEIEKTFNIVPLDVNNIPNLQFVLEEGPFTYKGSDIEPYVDGLYYEIGEDRYYVAYDEKNIVYTNNKETGTGTVEITGIENYTGKISQNFTIQPRDYTDFDRVWVNGAIYSETYTGEAYTPKVEEVYYDGILVDPASYKVEYQDNINAGTAKILITGTDKNNVGTYVKTFEIEPEWLDYEDVTMPYKRVLYVGDGKPIEAEPTVVHEEKTLVRDKDYTVTYEGDTTKPGVIKTKVKGIGNYQGEYEYSYEIVEDGTEAAKGVCGKYSTWTLYHKGVDYKLVISGNGITEDYYKGIDEQGNYIYGGIAQYEEDIVEVEIKQGIDNIFTSMFEDFTRLETVSIPNDLTSIGNYAFDNCTSLKEITIPEGVTALMKGAFRDCVALEKITLPKTLERLDASVFSGCKALTGIELNEGLTSIGNECFSSCSALTSIEVPDSVSYIGSDAFYFCTALKTAKLPNSLYDISEALFEGCENLETVIMPSKLTNGTIFGSAFDNCKKLTSISIPDGTKNIITGAFANCIALKEVSFPSSIKEIGSGAFLNCTAISKVYYAGTPTGWDLITIRSGNEAIENADLECAGVDVTGIGIETTSLDLALGDDYYLNAWVIPANASGKTINWTTSDPKVATVDEYGWIEALGIGTAVITATTAEGGFSATCTVTVTEGGGQIYDLANCTIILNQDTFTYTGDIIMPEITVKDGNETLVPEVDYHAYAMGCIDVGVASLELRGLGRYAGTFNGTTYTIIPKSTTVSKITPLATGLKVTWKKVAGVTGYKVYRNNKLVKTVTSASTLNYSDKAAKTNGTKYTYKVVAYKTVNGVKYNAKASATKSYYFLTKPTIKSLTNSASKAMTVKWTKNAKTTGYKIQYSLKSNFSSPKTVTIKKAGTLSKKITSLKKGKTYYVRIRCYKGSSYSTWSAVKKVKISK